MDMHTYVTDIQDKRLLIMIALKLPSCLLESWKNPLINFTTLASFPGLKFMCKEPGKETSTTSAVSNSTLELKMGTI